MAKKTAVTYSHQTFVPTTVQRLSQKNDGSFITVELTNNVIVMKAVVKGADEGLNIDELVDALNTDEYEFNVNTVKTSISNLRTALEKMGRDLPSLKRKPRTGGGRTAAPTAEGSELGDFFDDLCPSEEGPDEEGVDGNYDSSDDPSVEDMEALLGGNDEDPSDEGEGDE